MGKTARLGIVSSFLVLLLAGFLGSLLGACGDDNGSVTFDAKRAVDAAVPTPDAPTIENLAINETRPMAGLTAAVEVVRDNRGAPHIYAANLPDAVRVQAYLMARDRFGQMEFLRRLALGRLAELIVLTDPVDTVGLDRDARFLGYGREGRAIYDSIPPTDITRQIADAFVAGMNDYIDEVKAATDKTPFIPTGAETVYGLLFGSEFFGHWEPADVFALARYQATNLSYDPDSDILRTKALLGVQTKLDEAHQGAFVDMFSEIQARRVYTLPGFPSTTGKATQAKRLSKPKLPNMATLDAALAYLGKHRSLIERFEGRGSNNWVVSGSKSASHAPLLANDPHLSLISPAVWWYAHINTKRFGGANGVNVNGVAFAGLPGVVLGFNEDMAWGATVSGFDVTDVYDETVTEGATPTVRWKGTDVALTQIAEVIHKAGMPDETYIVEVVPHHGPILPGTHANGKALSVKYTGHTPSNELAYFTGLASAKSVDDAWAAQANFRVGGQNFVTISRSGDIAWNTEVRVPVRDDRALTLQIGEHGEVTGICPTFVLPGNGDYEWTGDLPSALIPKDRNPIKGFIATANQDSVGVTDDGNPCNQANHYYLGGGFADGYREGRIVERLTTLTAAGAPGITKDDMIALQAETQSQMGDSLRQPFVDILERVTASGSSLFTQDEKTQLTDVKARLMAWSKKTPHGVGATDATEIADSVATTIFIVGVTRIIPLAFGDEAAAIGVTPFSSQAAVLLQRALTEANTLATYDGTDSILWDDINTAPVETKDVIVGRGFLAALSYLRGRLGNDESTWRWGRLHTVRFESILPASPALSIPTENDSTNPDGFPRHGDWGAVDVGNFSLWSTTNFMHTAGPSQRLVVEMLPTGPKAYNALPGGQSISTTSPHHDDEARLYWITNQQKEVNFVEADVVKNAEARLRFTP